MGVPSLNDLAVEGTLNTNKQTKKRIQARTQGGCPGCPGNHLFVFEFSIEISLKKVLLAVFDLSFKKGHVKVWLPNEIDQNGNT